MKGYDIAVFPREGEPTLIAIEPQEEDARRTAWTQDIRLFKGYHERDPRPPSLRSLDVALQVLKERGLTGRVGLELSQGTQSADRMVGEPTHLDAALVRRIQAGRARSGGCFRAAGRQRAPSRPRRRSSA